MKRPLTLVAYLLAIASPGLAASPKPNIILILADDLGYETIGANGGQSYATPNLDALAATGVRFRHAYAQPICTPTRAQLMTGKYNIRNYSKFGILAPGQTTFANLLRDAGYKTFIAGKWQLAGDFDAPIAFGFDEYFLTHLFEDTRRYYAPEFGAHIPSDGFIKTLVSYPAGTYGPDLIIDKTLEFIDRNQTAPFLAYCPISLAHFPFTPPPDHPDYDPTSITELNDPVYFGSMVEYMDKHIGRIVGKLDELGLRNSTLIVFMGDNGTWKGITSMFEGQAVQGGKGKTTNAGTHVPFIANWPNTIPTQVSDTLINSSDILPTLCEVARIPIPPDLDGRSFHPQLLGQAGTPREWYYSWSMRAVKGKPTIKEFARTERFKLYLSGKFYDLDNDELEEFPLAAENEDANTQLAFDLLSNALWSFNNARLDRSLAPRANPATWESPPVAAGEGIITMTATPGIDTNGPVEYQFKNITLGYESAWQFGPAYSDSQLVNGTTYAYQVRMRDVLGNTTEWSDEHSATAGSFVLRKAPERAVGTDKRAGKRGVRWKSEHLDRAEIPKAENRKYRSSPASTD